MTLIGFLRGEQMNVYAGHERIMQRMSEAPEAKRWRGAEITVSDSRRGVDTDDRSGDVIVARFALLPADVVARESVPDDVESDPRRRAGLRGERRHAHPHRRHRARPARRDAAGAAADARLPGARDGGGDAPAGAEVDAARDALAPGGRRHGELPRAVAAGESRAPWPSASTRCGRRSRTRSISSPATRPTRRAEPRPRLARQPRADRATRSGRLPCAPARPR